MQKVLLMPSRWAASFTPSTITMQKREYGAVIPLGFSSARRSTSSVWLKPGRKAVPALCKFGRNQGAKAFVMSKKGHSRPNWAVRAMSGLPPIATELRTSL